ncbi:MAG: hypothetical protein J6T80_06165 [Paludibacteraceae bacterium]|nr:hypothetical protein [Paludibacteraceae bacterium]
MKKILVLAAFAAAVLLNGGVCRAAETEVAPKQSVPAYRGLIVRDLPDGYKLRTYLRGDERMHWQMTEDLWQIFETNDGWFKYAKLNRKGEPVMSRKKAHNAEDRKKCEMKWLNKHGVKKNL